MQRIAFNCAEPFIQHHGRWARHENARPTDDWSERRSQFMRKGGKEDVLGGAVPKQLFIGESQLARLLFDSAFEFGIDAFEPPLTFLFRKQEPPMLESALNRQNEVFNDARFDQIVVRALS